MPAAVVGGIVAGVGAIGASVVSSSATKKAANTAAAAQQQAVDHSLTIANKQEKLVRDVYAQNTTNMRPQLEAGYGALGVVQQLLGVKSQTAEQFSAGERYIPGTIDYSKPEQVRAENPAPAAGSDLGGNPALAAQAEAAVARGANPILIAQRMMEMRGGGMTNAL